MKLAVRWGRQGESTVSTVAQLDAVLDAIAGAGKPQVVDLLDPARDDPWGERVLVQVGVGHANRSFVMFDADSVWAVEPGVEALAEPVWFDYGGTPTEYQSSRTRVRSETARQAAREFMLTEGRRPTCVDWAAA